MIIGPSETFSLAGVWSVSAGDGELHNMKLPGTLDENNIGHKDTLDPETDRMKSTDGNEAKDPLDRLLDEEGLFSEEEPQPEEDHEIRTRFTRKYTYEGAVRISRMITFREKPGKRYFIEAERARVLSLLVDGKEVPHFMPATLSVPHIFEVTGLLSGNHMLTFISDNSYPGLPRDSILQSNMASDETQTNWNGLLGFLRVREEEENFVAGMNVRVREGKLSVFMEIYASRPGKSRLRIASDVLTRAYEKSIVLKEAYNAFMIEGLPTVEAPSLWDENEGTLHTFSSSLDGIEKNVSFGIRTFENGPEGRLLLNGRKVFLRTETNCAVHPETAYPPMNKASWEKILKAYQRYGANCVRFHSNCPPEAAFQAADEAGMLMIPELSLYRPRLAFGSEKSREYYRSELLQLLRTYGNHPSFVMLSFGSEIAYSEENRLYAEELLALGRSVERDRLFSSGAGAYSFIDPFEDSGDFIALSSFGGKLLRGISEAPSKEERSEGFVNRIHPNSINNYNETAEKALRSAKKALLSFEAGQYGILPDYKEIDLFSGCLEPQNLIRMKEKTEEQGLLTQWPSYVEASGETALLCYRMECEAALRTPAFSGIYLMGLQDYPGFGGSFHGMMNAHFQPKPYAFSKPEHFRRFFGPVVLMADLSGFTYEIGETLSAALSVANYGKEDLSGELFCVLSGEKFRFEKRFSEDRFPAGEVKKAGEIEIPLNLSDLGEKIPAKLKLTLRLGKQENDYPVWVYDSGIPLCPETVYETGNFDQKAVEILSQGGTVFFTPKAAYEALPGSVHTQFSPVFRNTFLYPFQSSTRGLYIDKDHPVFREFPTESFADLSWWPMTTGRAVEVPGRLKRIITVPEDPESGRILSSLFEFRYLSGNVLFSAMGIKENMAYPEARALLKSIYLYLESYDFSPSQELRPEELKEIIGN